MTSSTEHLATVLAVAAPNGPPSVALLSRGEVLSQTETTLRLALHASSGTAANLARTGTATLLRVEHGVVQTLMLRAARLGAATVDGTELALFEATVTAAREHAVPYATVTSGITFALHDEGRVRGRWERTQAVLRAAGRPT